MGRIEGLFRIIRPINGLMMGLAVLIGGFLTLTGLPSFKDYSQLLLGYVTAFSLSSASMTLNDYFDQEVDKVNEPQRPIPHGDIKPNEALFMTR